MKFSRPDDEAQAYIYPDVWSIEETSAGPRLVIAPASSQVHLVRRLLDSMPGPWWLLYVLVAPRGGGHAGRYQSPQPGTREEIEEFLSEFQSFLETDGRHHLWIASSATPDLLVYDRHNLIYAYGSLDDRKPILAQNGLEEAASIYPPDPHTHYYHEIFDGEERKILAFLPWIFTPLRPQDEE